jgi:hypothetical protein
VAANGANRSESERILTGIREEPDSARFPQPSALQEIAAAVAADLSRRRSPVRIRLGVLLARSSCRGGGSAARRRLGRCSTVAQ